MDLCQEKIIRKFAYEKWKNAGCPQGCDVHFWLEAEREFRELQKGIAILAGCKEN